MRAPAASRRTPHPNRSLATSLWLAFGGFAVQTGNPAGLSPARGEGLNPLAIRPNASPAEGERLKALAIRCYSSAARADLGRAPFGRELVEHAVDVRVSVVGAEALGD